MSYKLVDAVFVIHLTATEKAVLCSLCRHAKDGGPVVWASVPTLALESGASIRTVQRILRKFERLEFIKDQFGNKAGGGAGSTVYYRILIPNSDIVAAIQSEYNNGDGPSTGDKATPPGDKVTPPGDKVTPVGVTR
jgi:hypothetical protein